MTDFVAHWGYLGVFIAIFAEEAGVPLPVPGDVFIAALGAAGRLHESSFVLSAIVVLVASLGGSAVLFEISRRLGEPMLVRVGTRFGFDAARRERVQRWLEQRGAVAVAVGRLAPGFRIVVTVVAGALRMNRVVFLIGTAVASLLWATIYYWLGFALGVGVATALKRAFGRAIHDPDTLALLVTVILVVAATGGTVVWRRRRARRERSTERPSTEQPRP